MTEIRIHQSAMNPFPFLFISAVAMANVAILWTFRRAFGVERRLIPLFALLTAGLVAIFFRSVIRHLPAGDTLLGGVYLWLGILLVMGMVVIGGNLLRLVFRLSRPLVENRYGSISPAYPIAFLLCITLFGLGINKVIPLWMGILLAGLASAGRNVLYRFLVSYDVLRGDSLSTLTTGVVFYRLLLLAGAIAFAYSLYEARAVRVERLAIVTPRLPTGTDRLRIVAVSDIHLTRRGDGPRLERLVRLVNEQKPDIVVMLGDLVDDWLTDQDDLIARLRQIAAPGGKYAIIGNHEVYNSLEQSTEFTERAGFTLLRGRVADAGPILVAGVDDPAVADRTGIAATLQSIGEDARFVLLLTHRPEWVGESNGKFDLQLSGHTHGGQLLPARALTTLLFNRNQGLNRPHRGSGRESLVYVTNGAGYWGPPVRLGAPPEIVVVDLIRKR